MNEAFRKKQSENGHFSLRSWAKALGLVEATPLSQILKGRRPIPRHYLPKLTKTLDLTRLETSYLEALIASRQARTHQEKLLWCRRADQLHMRATFVVDYLPDLRLYENPLVMVLLGLIETRGFQENTTWIRSRLRIDASAAEIRSGIQVLIREDVVKRAPSGKLVRNLKYAFAPADTPSVWVRKFHEASLRQAVEAVHVQATDEREFASYVMAVKRAEMPAMKKAIRSFSDRMISRYAAETGTGDEVYHLNINLFAQTRPEGATR